MATSISEITSGIRSKPLSEYEWWKHHTVFFVSLFFVLPMVLTFYFGLAPVYDKLGVSTPARLATNGVLYILAAILVVTYVGALFGYYFDAQYIETLDNDWSPHWILYTAVHVIPILGALIAIPIYVFQRLRHVGLPIFG